MQKTLTTEREGRAGFPIGQAPLLGEATNNGV
jgi:hypothetical protein